jgi:PLAT/LH2 domain
MALMRPFVVGPLSELSASVRMRGQLPGATVSVHSSSRVVATGVAGSADQRFPLLWGVTLKPNESLYAIQQMGTETSEVPTGNQGMAVGPGPKSAADIGLVRIATHLYACGRYLWIDGAIPGARVELLDGAALLGSGSADEGVARFALTSAIASGSSLAARQSAPGLGPGPGVSGAPEEIPGNRGSALPPPTMELPLRGCDVSIMVTGVYDGALVTIERKSGIVESAGFDLGALRFSLTRPLDEDDVVTIRQEVDRKCERPTTTSKPIIVGKAAPVDPPTVVSPLCAGATVVRVTGLRPGAVVHLAANQDVYDGAVPPDQTWLDCRVPPLTTDPVSASQELCGVTSAPAIKVTVDPHEDNVAAPEIVAPLFSCCSSVTVTKAHRGAILQVFARVGRNDVPISDQVMTPTTNATVTVTPLLVTGWDVFVRQWACSATSADSAPERVADHPALGVVQVMATPIAGDRSVGVRGAVAGAVVEVSTLGHNRGSPEYLGSATADSLHPATMVGLRRELQVEENLIAVQHLCGVSSGPAQPVSVVAPAAFGPRPFYVVGHNPNTIAEAKKDVNSGANALEPDVQIYSKHPDQLCINHGTGGSSAPSLVSYLDGLHTLAAANPQLALVVFDCKQEATSSDHGFELLTAIRKHLTFDNDLNVIISIGNRDDNQGAFFDRIVDILGPREGLMIDAEDDPGAVTNYFNSRGVTNQGYGNGISFANFILGPYYRYTLEAACGIRAQAGRPRFIYVWTVNSHADLREYIRIGVDGAITDDVGDLRSIATENQFNSVIRLATRADNPFRPANFAYGLHIHTADKWMAGTDANVTFTITGSLGSASKTVDTELIKRMETDDWNWVTIESDDLGALQTMTVQRDNSGNGPDWFLDRIDVRSARFGATATAVFNRDIDSTSPFSAPLL